MYYDEEMFGSTTDFDKQIDEFKESLKASVREEYLEKIARLEKELEELKYIKENWREKVDTLENERRIASEAQKKAIETAKEMRLSELLSDCFCGAWSVTCEWYYPHEKCDKCDKDGYIRFKSPQGTNLTERCNCRKQANRYVVKEAKVVSFEKKHNSFKTIFKYAQAKEPDGTEELETVSNTGFSDKKEFAEINYRRRIFKSKEEAQKYCDWLNKKQEEK